MSRPRLDELPDVLTAADVAAVTGLGENLVYRLLGRGELPGRKLGGRWIVSRAALERALGVPDDEDEPAEPELRAVE